MTFNSGGKNYTVTSNDIFMHNGAVIAFIKDGKRSNPNAQRVLISDKEWQRIKANLNEIDYEEYYGRKPLVKVSIYIPKS